MVWLLVTTLSGLCLALAYYYVNLQRYKSLARTNGCQPPRLYAHKDPIFGLDLFIQEGRMFSEHTFFPITAQRYKENGTTFETRSLAKPTICSCEPDNLQSVFASNARKWGVSYRLPALNDYFGRGFLTTDGVEWEHSRALLTPSFTKSNLSDHTDFNHHLELMMKQIPRDGSTVDLQELLFSLVSLQDPCSSLATPIDSLQQYLDTATLFLFGNSFDSLSGTESSNARSFIHSAAYSLGGGGLRMGLGPLMFLHRDPKWNESNKRVHQVIDKYVDEALERQKLGVEREERLNGGGRKRLVLLDAMAEQSNDRIQLRNEALQAFIAAHETTACLISNIFFQLARHPAAWTKLREEVLALGDVPLDFEVSMKLKYLRNVINESKSIGRYILTTLSILSHTLCPSSPPISSLSLPHPRRTFRHHLAKRRRQRWHIPYIHPSWHPLQR